MSKIDSIACNSVQDHRTPVQSDQLRLLNLAALDAARAHPDLLRRAIHHGLHRLKIHIPAALRHVVGVRNVVPELWPLAANITYLCHLFSSKLVSDFRASRTAPRGSHPSGIPSAQTGDGRMKTHPTLQLAESLVYPEPLPQPNTPHPKHPRPLTRRRSGHSLFLCSLLPTSMKNPLPDFSERGIKECSHMRASNSVR